MPFSNLFFNSSTNTPFDCDNGTIYQLKSSPYLLNKSQKFLLLSFMPTPENFNVTGYMILYLPDAILIPNPRMACQGYNQD